MASLEASTTKSLEDLLERGAYSEAHELLSAGVAAWEQVLDEQDDAESRIELGKMLLSLGMVQDRLTMHEEAELSFIKASKLIPESEVALLGDLSDAQGKLAQHRGRLEVAEHHLRRAIAWRVMLPSDERQFWVNVSRDHLALLLMARGKYREAGVLLHDLLDATAEDDSVMMAQRLANLARYFEVMHDYVGAENLIKQAISKASSAWGKESTHVLNLRAELGSIYLHLQRYDAAEEELLACRKLVTAQSDEESLHAYLVLMNNIGSVYLEKGDFEDALSVLEMAINTGRESLDEEHAALASLHFNLGVVLQKLEKFSQAEHELMQAKSLYEDFGGDLNQRMLQVLQALALNSHFSQQSQLTRERALDASQRMRGMILRLTKSGSDRQRLRFYQEVDPALLIYLLPAEQIADYLANSKGRILDALISQKDHSDHRWERAAELQRELDLLDSSEVVKAASLRKQIDQVYQNNERQNEGEDVTWLDIQAALPDGAVFIDTIRYLEYLGPNDRIARYGAVIIKPQGKPIWVELGYEDSLMSLLTSFQERVKYRSRVLANEPAAVAPLLKMSYILERLHREFWAPVAEQLGDDVQSVCLSPDGLLNSVSFAVLTDADGVMLSEVYPQFVYMDSARSLLHTRKKRNWREDPWAIYAMSQLPNYIEAESDSTNVLYSDEMRELLGALDDISGVDVELDKLKHLAPEGSDIWRNQEFTERRLRALQESPAVLHCITHGFFLGHGQSQLDKRGMYQSGLVLYDSGEAMRQISEGQLPESSYDGFLFAEEASLLPLGDTELVVLSACDTGQGIQVSGEGIVGLRRGFAIAGAKNQLVSLWAVLDQSAPQMVESFYRKSIESNNMGGSLWAAQGEFLKNRADDEASLEEAVLRYGAYAFYHSGPIDPPLRKSDNAGWKRWRLAATISVGGVVLIGLAGYQKNRRKRVS